MAPPEERAWSCALLHAFDDAKTDEAEIAADLAFADAIAIARWAVSTHGPVRSPDSALARAPLRESLSPADRARLMRFAQAHPWRAIAAGVAASILTKNGAAHAHERAQKWRGIGDAPMDLIAEAICIPSGVATMTRSAREMNKPVSTTPGILRIARSSAAGSAMGPVDTSRM